MTYNETTLFRRFMTNKGVLNNFEYLYVNHRFEPKSIEQYYEDTEADVVIMTAFDFSKCGNSIFNYRYWESLDQKWQFCLKKFREEGKMENPPELRCAKCGKMKPLTDFVLGKMLVPHKFCKECETKLTAVKVASSDKDTFKVCPHCGKKKNISEFYERSSSADGHQSYCKDCMREAKKLLNQKENTEKMEDFTFYDFEKVSPVRERKIEDGYVAINYKNKGSYITLSKRETNDIQSEGLSKVRVRVDNITGAMHLVFNNEHGVAVTFKKSYGYNIKTTNAILSSQQLVDFIVERLNLEKKDGSRYLVNIGNNLSKTDGFLTYNVKR